MDAEVKAEPDMTRSCSEVSTVKGVITAYESLNGRNVVAEPPERDMPQTRSSSELHTVSTTSTVLKGNDMAERDMLRTRSSSELSAASTSFVRDDSPHAVAKRGYDEEEIARLRARLRELEEESQYQRTQNEQKSAHISGDDPGKFAANV
jgi:hypothetical protein